MTLAEGLEAERNGKGEVRFKDGKPRWQPKSLDGVAAGHVVKAVRREFCKNGHELTDETRYRRRTTGWVCRVCDAARKRGELVRLARQQDEIVALSRKGMEAREIAEELGCPIGSVYQARHKFRRQGEEFVSGRPGRPPRPELLDAYEDKSGPRCRCGLRIDKDHTLETCDFPTSATAWAQQRREHWSDEIERPGFLATGGKGR